ncbi:MAG: recombinase RecT [Schwartzia sp. (in: firmicutes)]
MTQTAVAMKNTANAATIEDWVESDKIKRKFNEVLDNGAGAFVTSLLSLVKSTPQLAAAEPKTVISAAMTAATLKLPINPNLGFAYIIPYGHEAQFQMGWKGYVQLAMRTGQYKTINAAVVYEGQIEDMDFITGEIIKGKKKSDKVVGYVAYFELINGFKKTFYMTREDMLRHAQTFSKSYAYDKRSGKGTSVWSTNFDAMGLKTVIKQLISKYGIMSIDM